MTEDLAAIRLANTHPSVLEGIAAGAEWADPAMDPTEIDWPARQARAAIPFRVIDGAPVNPCAPTGIRYGRNECGHWGEALAADALVLVHLRVSRLRTLWRWLTRRPTTVRYVLMVERADRHGWALPGGHVDPEDKTAIEAAARELREEATLDLSGASWTATKPRYVPDPRASDEAWMVTVLCSVDLGRVDLLPEVTGADDAAQAAWVRANSYEDLVAYLEVNFQGRVFPAHVEMLEESL